MASKRYKNEPKTESDWQAAVNAAAGLRAIADCKMYGLIDGGPLIDVDRCDDMIARGEAIGIRPNAPIDNLVLDLVLDYNNSLQQQIDEEKRSRNPV